MTLLNSSHKGPEPQSDLKHLAHDQSHYKTDLNSEMKGGWDFALNASLKCDLAYLWPQSDLKHLVQNQNHYETNLSGAVKRGWAFVRKSSYKCDLSYI